MKSFQAYTLCLNTQKEQLGVILYVNFLKAVEMVDYIFPLLLKALCEKLVMKLFHQD
ncbi:hypothetical protein KKB18_03485 [bacterium]|nr:hypothetical protein [bacterium]